MRKLGRPTASGRPAGGQLNGADGSPKRGRSWWRLGPEGRTGFQWLQIADAEAPIGHSCRGVERQPVSETTWRVSGAGRVSAVLLVVIWVALAAALSADGNWAAAVLGVIAVIGACGAWRWAFVPYVAVGPDGVRVQNAFTKVTLSYSEIRQVRVGYYGLVLLLTNGGAVTAWAVQKSNWARWRHTTTRADHVGAAITARLGPTKTLST